MARTSAFRLKGDAPDLREVGEKLNVKTVLEGSVRKAGNRLRINAQLINAENGYHLWSERHDRDLEDVFEVQDEISHSVVEKLKVKLLGKGDARRGAARRPSASFTDHLYGARLNGTEAHFLASSRDFKHRLLRIGFPVLMIATEDRIRTLIPTTDYGRRGYSFVCPFLGFSSTKLPSARAVSLR